MGYVHSVRIRLHDPVIEGNRIVYSWSCRHDVSCFRADRFYVDFPDDLDPAKMPTDLLYFAFIGLLSQHLSLLSPIRVELESAVDSRILEFWHRVMQLHHRVDPYAVNRSKTFRVRFVPQGRWKGRAIDSSSSPREGAETRNCLMYGGGKDALAQLGMLLELFPGKPLFAATVDDLVAPSFVPMLREIAGHVPNIIPLRLETDIKRVLRPIGIIMWPLISLPLLSQLGVTHCYWGIEVNLSRYVVRRAKLVPWKIHTTQTLLSAVNRLAEAMGWPARMLSLLTPISTYGSQQLLVRRYPHLLRYQQSCIRGTSDKPYCSTCSKCFGAALVLASLGQDPADIGLDLGALLASEQTPRWVFHPADLRPGLALISNLAEQAAEQGWARLVKTGAIDAYLTTQQARDNYELLRTRNPHSSTHDWIVGHVPATLPYVLSELPAEIGEDYNRILEEVFPWQAADLQPYPEAIIDPTAWDALADWLAGRRPPQST